MTEAPTSSMTEEDWIDVAESAFVDVARGEQTDKIGFVFEHPEGGLHGFEYFPDTYHIRPVSYSVIGDDDD